MKTELATGVASTEDYAEAKEPWFDEADVRARGLGRAHRLAAADGLTPVRSYHPVAWVRRCPGRVWPAGCRA